MLKYSLCLVVALAAVVCAYDFRDSDFNQVLLNDLELFNNEDSAEASRTRRHADGEKMCGHHDRKKEFHCCKTENFDDNKMEVFRDAKKQCYAEVKGANADDSFDPFDCKKMQQVQEDTFCVLSCVAKKFNLLDEAGDMKRDDFVGFMRKAFSENKWKLDILEATADKCLAEAKMKKEQRSADEQKGCNRNPMDFSHCFWREYSNACPAEMRVDTPKCQRFRDRLAKGDTSVFNKHYIHHYVHQRHHEE